MAAGIGVARVGAIVGRNLKSVLPILVLAAYSLAVPPEEIFGSSCLEHFKDGVALVLALAGLTLRAFLHGAVALPRDRSGAPLRTEGVYALSRNPLYAGSLLICAGIFLMHGSLHVVLIGTIACVVLYGIIVRSEEAELQARFGESYRAYCARTPRWVPGPAQFARLHGVSFDVRRAISRDWPVLAVTLAALWLTEHYEYMPDHVAAQSQLYLMGMAALAVCGATIAVLVQAWGGAVGVEDYAGRTDAPETLGIRVDGRANLVDRLENMLSFGQQEAILASTLEAAELRPGETLLDVGCGTGKLCVAAVRTNGGSGRVVGVDATPGMIDLAWRRAREAGVRAEFQVGVAEALPLPDGTAEAVTSSYFFHHLPSHVKPLALREMWRVLAPGGRLVITDYGRARGLYGLALSLPMRANFHEYVRPQLGGELEAMIAAEGLGPAETVDLYLGYITVMRLRKPL